MLKQAKYLVEGDVFEYQGRTEVAERIQLSISEKSTIFKTDTSGPQSLETITEQRWLLDIPTQL